MLLANCLDGHYSVETCMEAGAVPVDSVTINLTGQVGADDLLFALPVVEESREGCKIFCRTLRPGEAKPERAVIYFPERGEKIIFKPGSIVVSIEEIDRIAEVDEYGYAPITNTLWTWMEVAKPKSKEGYLFLLAASRRLDATSLLRASVIERRSQKVTGFIKQRGLLFESIALAELLIVSLGRVADMADRIKRSFAIEDEVPQIVSQFLTTIRTMRNAFEHIDERAFGKVKDKSKVDPFSVFEQTEFISNCVIRYGSHRIDLLNDLPPLLSALRGYFIKAAVARLGLTATIA
jgi:hypothetical protein